MVIEQVVERWHQYLRGELSGGLESLLSDEVVFYSPVVFTPQRGKAITTLYLNAAAVALGGEGTGAFRYVKQILADRQAMLEFETTVEGKHVNGVDILTCDEDGRIVEFKVMIRPLQAVNLVHKQMAAMLEQMNG